MASPADRMFLVSGVCCSAEEAVLCKRLDQSLGVGSYRFDLLTGELLVQKTGPSDAAIRATVHNAGFRAQREGDGGDVREPWWRLHPESVSAGVSGLLFLGSAAADAMGVPPAAVHAGLAAALASGGWHVFRRAWRAIRASTLDMNVLMSVAAAGAVLLGKWYEGAAVLLLYTVSLMLESFGNARTRRALRALTDVTPALATVLKHDKELRTPAADVSPGDQVLIRPGEAIPLDGIVLEGTSALNASMMTGESTPREVAGGDEVLAGTINGAGSLRIRVTRPLRETTLARMVRFAEEARQHRAPFQIAIDRFARVYTPAVLALAAAVAVVPPIILQEPFTSWFYRSLVLLVVACPCALVIATPITVISALTNAARRGIFIKGGKYLEIIAGLKAVAFDKTGTLTTGKPVVTDILSVNHHPADSLLPLIAAIERRSEHHLAGAILAEADRRSIAYRGIDVDRFESLPGLGVKAAIEGVPYFIGNLRMCNMQGARSGAVEHAFRALVAGGKTAIVFGRESEPMCILATKDALRPQAGPMVALMRKLGIRHMEMLSGDHAVAADDVGASLGFDAVGAGLLPDGKVEAMRSLVDRFGTAAMVGDGINDAQALATASVGIAMGGVGAGVALEQADIVLMSDDLLNLPALVRLGRQVMRLVRQNVAFALGLKLLFVLLGIAGIATLWTAVLADDGAALLVIVNGLRMLSYDK